MTPSYFTALRIPLVKGRLFTEHDNASASGVAIVDEVFARTLDPAGEVVGRRIRWLRQPDVDVEIVGIAGGVRHRHPAEPPAPTVYRPIAQYPRTSMYFAVRTSGDPARFTDGVTAAIASVSRVHPVADVATMEQRVADATARATASLALTAMLAALALALGSIGLYGVISFGVSQRRREFGVRLALGATAAGVRRLVIGDGLFIVTGGLAAGTFGAFTVARAAGHLLYGVTARDLPPDLAGAFIVVMCSAVAFWIPARRAGAVDPATTLRSD